MFTLAKLGKNDSRGFALDLNGQSQDGHKNVLLVRMDFYGDLSRVDYISMGSSISEIKLCVVFRFNIHSKNKLLYRHTYI